MTNNDMKQIKFDMLVKDIDKAMYDYDFREEKYNSSVKRFNEVYDEITPLCLFFDTKLGNYYKKSIFLNARILCNCEHRGEPTLYTEQTFSDNIAKKLYLTKALVGNFRRTYAGKMYFIFWALLAACVDKTDYDEKISMIVDFAHMVNIDEDDLFDITQVIKVTFGEEERENIKFKTNSAPSQFENVLSLFKK